MEDSFTKKTVDGDLCIRRIGIVEKGEDFQKGNTAID